MGPSARLNLIFLPHVSDKTAGGLDIQQNTVDPPYVALSVPHLAIPVQTTPQQNASMQTAPKNIMSSFKAVPSISIIIPIPIPIIITTH